MKLLCCNRLIVAGLLLALASPFVVAETTYHPVWTNAEGEPWRNEDGLCWRDPTRTGAPTPACGDPAETGETATSSEPVASDEPVEQVEQSREIHSEILFAFDSAALTSRGQNAIRAAVGDIDTDWRTVGVEAIGHTDRLGSAAYNRTLSQARADAVADHLDGLSALNGVSIQATGAGESDPIVECADDLSREALIECLAPNRRTELVFTLSRGN